MSAEVAIIDSGGANIASLRYALQRLGANGILTGNPRVIRSAPRVILPGVGAAPDAMARLRELNLTGVIRGLDQPVLGICLGMQLLFDSSEEDDAGCLGLLNGRANRFQESDGLPIPHMGWNRIEILQPSRLLQGIESGCHFYFCHSYRLPVSPTTVAGCRYGSHFAAAAEMEHLFCTQFHPERSGTAGARLLHNFLRIS